MNWIKKKQEPKKLTFFRNAGGTWDTFSQHEGKEDVKNQLLTEQYHLCAYCTNRISFEKMKIEHWCARNTCKTNRNLDYTNLFAVCLGCYNSGEFFHCDTSKKDILIELNPLIKHHIQATFYFKSGEISSSNATHKKEIDTVLNLNIEPLKKARKTVLNTFRRELHKKYKGKKANYAKLLERWKNRKIPHSMIVVRYLEQKQYT